MLDQLGAAGDIDWSAPSSTVRACAPKKGSLTGPNSVDRGKPGSKIHVLSNRNGLPLTLGVSAANMHDSQAFEPLIQGIPKIRSRRGPRRREPVKVHADKAYAIPDCHRALREQRIGDRIARRGALGRASPAFEGRPGTSCTRTGATAGVAAH